MKIYSAHGINDFVICCGYKGYVIKDYFANYFLHMSDVTFDIQSNHMEVHQKHTEPWRVTLVDTGEHSLTAERLKRVSDYVGNEVFCFTYGDVVSNADISELIAYHRKQNVLVTVTAVQPPGRFGVLEVADGRIISFHEKPRVECGWINGGFFVVEPKAFDFINENMTSWEGHVLPMIAKKDQLAAFKHYDFWHAMDTQRDKNSLEELWNSGKAPWKIWKD